MRERVTHCRSQEMTELAGPQSYHQDDYAILYNNIKDNVAKRTAAFKASL